MIGSGRDVHRAGDRQSGFTIIETLIVLAATSVLFFMAMYYLGGKQNNAQFRQGVLDLQSQLQQSMNEVSSGYFTVDDSFKCMKDAVSGIRFTPGSPGLGTSRDCVYAGKALQFGVGSTGSDTFNVYTIGALREAAPATPIDYAAVRPRVIAKDGTSATASYPDVFETKRFQGGLTPVKMYYTTDDATHQIGSMAFVSSLGSVGSADTSQSVNLVAIPGTQLGQAKQLGVNRINAGMLTPQVNPPNGIFLCLRSGSTEQSVLVTIGGGGRLNSVETAIRSSVDCS